MVDKLNDIDENFPMKEHKFVGANIITTSNNNNNNNNNAGADQQRLLAQAQQGSSSSSTSDGDMTMTMEQYNEMLLQLQQLQNGLNQQHHDQMKAIHSLRQHFDGRMNQINTIMRTRFGGTTTTIQGGMVRQSNERTRQQVPNEEVNHGKRAQGYVVPGSSTLMKKPRSLEELWQEYKFGVNGRKAAEQFTSAERNCRTCGIKQKYYRRKIVWETIDRLIRKGYNVQEACHEIRACYGSQMSVTQIINKLLVDKRNHQIPHQLA